MLGKIKRGFKTSPTPEERFLHIDARRINKRRQEHLATLGLDLENKRVLEVGAGIGEHTEFFMDRGCCIVVTEPRKALLDILRERFHGETRVIVGPLNLDNPSKGSSLPFFFNFDIIYCYGVLYHLKHPEEAIKFMAKVCSPIGMLLLETIVSFGSGKKLNPRREDKQDPNQSVSGYGCRPTRLWVFKTLKRYFPFVYIPVTQPSHPEFPINWEETPVLPSIPPYAHKTLRAVFIASKEKIDNPLLVSKLPMKQRRE